MDKLVKADVTELNLELIPGAKSSVKFNLTNLMHAMPVAISLTSTNPSLFSFSQSFALLKPLSMASFTVLFDLSGDRSPVLSTGDSVLVRSSMLPTGRATGDDLRRLFSRTGKHIFRDAKIPIWFVGFHAAEFLVSRPEHSTANRPETNRSFVLQKAISFCCKSEQNSLLRLATENNNVEAVSALVLAGADVSSRDINGASAVSLAVSAGNAAAVELLIDSGYSIDNKIDRFLHKLAEMNRVDMMKMLCFKFPETELNSRDRNNRTALHIAAINGHVEALQFLLSAGCDPDVEDDNKWTPLHHASFNGHFDAVEILLSHGSIFSNKVVTKDKKTAYDLALQRGHTKLYHALHLGEELLHAASTGDVIAVKKCAAEGADVNEKDQNGWTALHRAAFRGRMECVKMLVSFGAKVDVVDDSGHAPLDRAVEGGHRAVALYLMAHGAKAKLKGVMMKSTSFKMLVRF